LIFPDLMLHKHFEKWLKMLPQIL